MSTTPKKNRAVGSEIPLNGSISKPHLLLEGGIVPVQVASDLHEGHVDNTEKNRADGSEIPLNGSISKPHLLLEGGIGQGYALVSFKTLHVDLASRYPPGIQRSPSYPLASLVAVVNP
jgi:hypothetical protein